MERPYNLMSSDKDAGVTHSLNDSMSFNASLSLFCSSLGY